MLDELKLAFSFDSSRESIAVMQMLSQKSDSKD